MVLNPHKLISRRCIMDKKEKDFLIGLMYNDGDLNHLSEGTTDHIGESYIEFNKEPGHEKDN